MLRRSLFSFLPFFIKVSRLKSNFRGQGQYAHSQQVARDFLDRNIPQNFEHWVPFENNALGVLQVCNFFEVDHPAKMAAVDYLKKNIELFPLGILLPVALALSTKYEAEELLKTKAVPRLMDRLDTAFPQHLAALAKLLQRIQCKDSSTWEKVANQYREAISATPRNPRTLSDHARAFSSFLAEIPQHVIVQHLRKILLDHIRELEAGDASVFIRSLPKFPIAAHEVMQIARYVEDFAHLMNGRDVSFILRSLSKLCENATTNTSGEAKLQLNFALHQTVDKIELKVRNMMLPKHRKYWGVAVDIVRIAFSFDNLGGNNQRPFFSEFRSYIFPHIGTLPPDDVGITTGVLRRSCCFDNEIAGALSKRVGAVIDELRFNSLSHIAANFAATSVPKPWWKKCRERLEQELSSESLPNSVLHCLVAFPSLKYNVDFDKISPLQLVDAVELCSPDHPLRVTLLQEAKKKLSAHETFVANQLEALLKASDDLIPFVDDYVKSCLEKEAWEVHTPALLRFAKGDTSIYESKVFESAKTHTASSQQFIQAVTLLLPFCQSKQIRDWIKQGLDELVEQFDSLLEMISFLRIAQDHKFLLPDAQWINYFAYKPLSNNYRLLTGKDILMVLKMLKPLVTQETPYTDVADTLSTFGAYSAGSDNILAAEILCAALDIDETGTTLDTFLLEDLSNSVKVPPDVRQRLKKKLDSQTQKKNSGLPPAAPDLSAKQTISLDEPEDTPPAEREAKQTISLDEPEDTPPAEPEAASEPSVDDALSRKKCEEDLHLNHDLPNEKPETEAKKSKTAKKEKSGKQTTKEAKRKKVGEKKKSKK